MRANNVNHKRPYAQSGLVFPPHTKTFSTTLSCDRQEHVECLTRSIMPLHRPNGYYPIYVPICASVNPTSLFLYFWIFLSIFGFSRLEILVFTFSKVNVTTAVISVYHGCKQFTCFFCRIVLLLVRGSIFCATRIIKTHMSLQTCRTSCFLSQTISGKRLQPGILPVRHQLVWK